MTNVLLDSNLIIYASRPQHEALRTFIARGTPSVSVVSKIETLGYHKLGEQEKEFLDEFFDAAEVLPVFEAVVTESIRLRQQRRMSLGDAMIAGTALSRNLTLATYNTSDFEWIQSLDIVDPVAEEQ
jgi:predicted nucleic acid-binding protein